MNRVNRFNRVNVNLPPLAAPPPIAYMSYVQPENMRTKQEIQTVLLEALTREGTQLLVLTGLKGQHIDRMLGAPSLNYVKVLGHLTETERETVRAVLERSFGFKDNLEDNMSN
jgi:hypothetical protein